VRSSLCVFLFVLLIASVSDSINLQAVPNLNSILASIGETYADANATTLTRRKPGAPMMFSRGYSNITDVHGSCSHASLPSMCGG
jgi:hypothetical protein